MTSNTPSVANASVIILHLGPKNKRIRGHFEEKFDSTVGKRYLVGHELVKELRYQDRAGNWHHDCMWMPFSFEITRIKYTKVK